MKYNINRKEKYSIATIEDNKNATVTTFVSVDIHEKNSLTEQTLQRLYSDALLSGTVKLTREEFLNKVNLLGASINVSIVNGTFFMVLKSTSETYTKLLSLVEEMFLKPSFSKTELTRIKATTINELHAEKENTKDIAQERLINAFYDKKDRRYTYEINEIISEITKIKTKQLKQLHEQIMSQFWICSAAGKKTHILETEKLISNIKKTTSHKKRTPFHKQKLTNQKLILKQVPSRQNIDFSIGAPIPITLHHPDYIPLVFAINVLAKWGGFAGRLMSTVREQEGLTYGIYARPESFSGDEVGHWRIMTFFAPDKALQGIESTFREVTNLYQNGITNDELKRFKTILNTQQILMQDSIVSLLKDLHTYHYHQFTLEEMKEHKERINSLKLKEVNSVIKKYLNPKDLTVSGAGPVKSVQKELKSIVK